MNSRWGARSRVDSVAPADDPGSDTARSCQGWRSKNHGRIPPRRDAYHRLVMRYSARCCPALASQQLQRSPFHPHHFRKRYPWLAITEDEPRTNTGPAAFSRSRIFITVVVEHCA